MIGLFVIFLGLIFFITFREPARTALFSSLPEHEKSRVMDVLRTNGIDVSIDSVGALLGVFLFLWMLKYKLYLNSRYNQVLEFLLKRTK